MPRPASSPIANRPVALEGARKQVTVLFADVKGSMELSEQMDPEQWSVLMQRFFRVLSASVERFDGFVDKFTGDGIMALFGAPIAHEDHAQRACYAALHMRDALKRHADELRRTEGISLSMRIGVNSGEVVVGTIGDDQRMEYTAQGHTVGLAQRMEGRAAPDGICVTAHTARLVDGFFELRDLGEFTLKGVSAPLRGYELVGVGALSSRLDASRARGFSRFIGRDAEMQALEAALARSLAGAAQVVGVVGEPGVGKSRLCTEFLDGCRTRGVAVYQGQCLSHGAALPFLPIVQLFRDYFGVRASDPPAAARQRIAGTLLLLDERFRAVLPLLFDFLGVPDAQHRLPATGPEARQRQLLDFAGELVRTRSAREPAVLLLDDLHWIDRGSDALLAQLIPSAAPTRTLFLLNFRPEYHADWMRRPDYRSVEVRPLGAEATAALLRELLGDDPSLAPLNARLRERAGGNPYFAEELVRSFAESGVLHGSPGAYTLRGDVPQTSIPPSLQSLLASRIDRLPPGDKAVLEAAAVIGKEFAESLLQAVTATSAQPPETLAAILGRLVRAELVVERARYPEAEYAFRHPLVQEVGYHSQLGERRARVHAQVARAIEACHGDALDEHAPLLAHHCEASGDQPAALRWHARAGAWFAVRDLAQSLAHHERVRALVAALPESAETTTLGASACAWILQSGWRLRLPAEEYPAVLTQGHAWAERSADPGVQARMFDAQATLMSLAGGAGATPRTLLERAIELGERTSDRSLQVCLHQRMVWLLSRTTNATEALAVAERAIALADDDVRLGVDVVGWSSLINMLQLRGSALAQLGRFADALGTAAQAERLAADLGDTHSLWFAYAQTSWMARLRGDRDGARVNALRTLEVAERLAMPLYFAAAFTALTLAHLEDGDWAGALHASERGFEILRGELPGMWIEPELALQQGAARALLGSGRIDRARAAVAELLALCDRVPELGFALAQAHLDAGHVLLRTDGPQSDAAGRSLDRSAKSIEAFHFFSLRPQLEVEYAERARLLGDDTACQRHRHEAHRGFVEIGATGHATRVARTLEQSSQ